MDNYPKITFDDDKNVISYFKIVSPKKFLIEIHNAYNENCNFSLFSLNIRSCRQNLRSSMHFWHHCFLIFLLLFPWKHGLVQKVILFSLDGNNDYN